MILTSAAKKSKDGGSGGLTESALAGLAAKEDYTSVKLKRSNSLDHVGEYPPFKDLMLIQIKGKPKSEVTFVARKVCINNAGFL